jgi:Retinoic acid induced 16-like protein/Family of unknown function (DUF5917)
MIFFHDKHWYHAEPLFSVTEEDEEELDDEEEEITSTAPDLDVFNQVDSSSSAPLSSEKKPEYEFLLFNYLLRFVHREGHIGDFARAGLLFLMDVAMSPGKLPRSIPEQTSEQSPSDPIDDAALALAEYILDGDFSEVLGAGLGAVYSLLPSKLAFYSNASLEASSGNGMTLGTGPRSENKEKEELAEKSRAMGVEDASNPEFKVRLDHFLKLLEFLQDVLRKNNSHDSIDASALVGTAIGQSILDAVRRIFLENVLYPSILECSDADGSAVAVMSYIEIMVRTLQSGPLADLLVNFLVNEDNDEVRLRQRPFSMLTLGTHATTSRTESEPRNNKLRRRKSSAMVLLEMEAPESRKKSEYFTSMGRFTLRDLLLSNLRSHSQSTATSALQLLQSMLLHHSQLTADRILLVIADPTATSFPHPAIMHVASTDVNSSNSIEGNDDDTFVYPEPNDEVVPTDTISNDNSLQFVQPETTYSTHEREMGLYLTLISRVDPSHNGDPFSTGYDHYLRDALTSIQSQSAYQLTEDDTSDIETRKRLKHRLNVNDPTLSLILESLRRFFSNTPEFNIALTGVLATLAIHPDRSLAGWLTFVSNDNPKPHEQESRGDPASEGDDGDDRSIDFGVETRLASDMNFLPASSMDENSRPVVHAIFHGLVTQLERYRLAVNNFDKFLLERRQGLLFSENLTDALTIALDLTEEPSTASAPTSDSLKPPNPKPKASASSSFVSFLTPKKNKSAKASTSSEPSTPSKGTKNPNIVASPFGKHYQDTGSIVVEPFVAPVPAATSWTPVKREKWTADEEDVFTSSGWSEEPQREFADDEEKRNSGKPTHVTLSQLLDNVVILEESIKELVAVIHARRSLGIDSIRYL